MIVTSLFVYYFGKSFHISDIHIIYKHIRLKAVVSQWYHRWTTVGVLVWEMRRRRFESRYVFSSSSPSSFCLCMCGNGEGFVHFLHIVAYSPAFPK